jgi:flagellar biosynthesis/type III secretory pathway protein FliH
MSTRIIRAPHNQGTRTRGLAPVRTRVLRAGHLEALSEAERILGQAREEAKTIVDRARAEAASLRLGAAQEGRAEAGALLAAARQRAGEVVDEARDELTRLAVGIAGKLLGEELRLDPDRIALVVGQCLRQAGAARRVVIRVNPADVPAVERAARELQELSEADVLQVEPDPAIGAGGCMLDTEIGQLDGRLETQLKMIQRALESDG